MSDIQKTLRAITDDKTLSPAQKAHYLALEAENMLDYPLLDAETQEALDQRVICDMYEGHAPYKPRYVLPDFAVVLKIGSEYLELPIPETLDEAINTPILGKEFKRPSTPPPYAALHNIAAAAIGITLRPWQDALAEYIEKFG